jgi:hypothetical protein
VEDVEIGGVTRQMMRKREKRKIEFNTKFPKKGSDP